MPLLLVWPLNILQYIVSINEIFLNIIFLYIDDDAFKGNVCLVKRYCVLMQIMITTGFLACSLTMSWLIHTYVHMAIRNLIFKKFIF